MSKYVRLDPGDIVPVGFSTSASIAGGGGVLVGNLFGVVCGDVASTSAAVDVQVRIRGGVQINKAASLAVGIGDVLYWDDSAKVVNKTATNKEVGIAFSSTGNSSTETTVNLLLIPTIRGGTGS